MSYSDLTTDSGIKFTVNISPEPRGRLVAALYNDQGNLVECHTVVPNYKNIDFEFSNTGSKIKIIWHDSELRPFLEEIEFNL